jgi:ferredoxin
MEMVQRGDMNNSECILCGECVDGCPRKVIGYGLKK